MLNTGALATDSLENRLLPFRSRRATRVAGQIGLVVLVVGAASVTKPDGVLFVLIGALLVVVYMAARFRELSARGEGRSRARQLAQDLRSGHVPAPVTPTGLSEARISLEPSESCFVAGAGVEIVQWYGDPVLLTRPMFFVWGSPLAWFATGMGLFIHSRRNRKRAKKAAPRWRDPERATLWLTDRRLLMHGGQHGDTWVQIRWPSIRHAALERDGIVMVLDEHTQRPMKIRTSAAAQLFVAYWYFSHQGAVYQI